MRKSLPLLALLTTSIIWGVTLPLMKVTLLVFPALSLAFFRFLIATTLSVSFSELSNLKPKDYLHIGFYAIFGITINIGLLLLGLKYTSTINAVLILSLSPLFTSLLAALTLKEKIAPLHLIGIILAFSGILVYILFPVFSQKEHFALSLAGDLLIFLSMFCAAVFTIGSKKLFEYYSSKEVSAVSFLVGVVSFLPFAVLEFVNNPNWPLKINLFYLCSLLFLGVCSAYLAYNLLEWGLSKVSVHLNQTISYLSTIIAIVLSYVFLGEKLYSVFPLSLLLVSLGIYLVTPYFPLHSHHHLHRSRRI